MRIAACYPESLRSLASNPRARTGDHPTTWARDLRMPALPLAAVAEVLVLLEPAAAALERQATLALQRAPAGQH